MLHNAFGFRKNLCCRRLFARHPETADNYLPACKISSSRLSKNKKKFPNFDCRITNESPKFLEPHSKIGIRQSSILCGANRDRTGNLLVANQALSQLSYSPRTIFDFRFHDCRLKEQSTFVIRQSIIPLGADPSGACARRRGPKWSFPKGCPRQNHRPHAYAIVKRGPKWSFPKGCPRQNHRPHAYAIVKRGPKWSFPKGCPRQNHRPHAYAIVKRGPKWS